MTAGADESLPGEETMLPQGEVKDRFFAYALGIVTNDITAEIPNSHLAEVLPEFAADPTIPFQEIRSIERHRLSSSERLLTTRFERGFDFAFPLRFLGIPLGAVTTSRVLAFHETIIGTESYDNFSGDTLELDRVHEFWVEGGELIIDFRDWVDLLLGRYVEDLEIIGGIVFRHDGTWYALGAGHDPNGVVRVGGYDFKHDRALIPVPDRFSGIMRGIVGRRLSEGRP
jgi:hypothetical protein